MGVIAFARSSARLHARLHDKLRSSAAAAGMTWKKFSRRGEGKKSKGPSMICCLLLTCAVNLAVRAVKLAVLPRANCAGSAVRRLQADIIVCGNTVSKPAVQKVFFLIHST